MYLAFDTSDSQLLRFCLIKPDGVWRCYRRLVRGRQTENLLPLLDDLLTKQGFKIKDCQGVAVVQGPGSFTALRLGVISANLIADFCQCPSVGLAATEFTADQKMVELIKQKISLADKQARVLPDYQKEPNITKPRL